MTHADVPDRDALASVRSLPSLATIEETAKHFRVSPRTVRRWTHDGRLRVRRTSPGGSGRVLIPRCELARFLSTLEQPVPCADQ